jgi:hypothetical protein
MAMPIQIEVVKNSTVPANPTAATSTSTSGIRMGSMPTTSTRKIATSPTAEARDMKMISRVRFPARTAAGRSLKPRRPSALP